MKLLCDQDYEELKPFFEPLARAYRAQITGKTWLVPISNPVDSVKNLEAFMLANAVYKLGGKFNLKAVLEELFNMKEVEKTWESYSTWTIFILANRFQLGPLADCRCINDLSHIASGNPNIYEGLAKLYNSRLN